MITTSVTAMAQRHGRHGGGYGPQQNQEINLYVDQEYQGQSVIALKRMANRQIGNLDLRDMELVAIKMLAKSLHGQGEAVLVTGQDTTYPATVPGNPRLYHSVAPRSFTPMVISAKNYGPDQGAEKWQVELKGNIKVKTITLIVKSQIEQKQEIVIPMYGQLHMGRSILALKQLIKQQNPYLDLQDEELAKVVLVAKSKAGNGQATLVTGMSAEYPETIPGSPRDFHSERPMSYSRVQMKNTSYSSQGKWQVELRGQIKIKEIIIKLKAQRGSQRGNGGINRPTPVPGPVVTPTRPGRGNGGGRGNGAGLPPRRRA